MHEEDRGGCEIKEKGDAISKLDISYFKFSREIALFYNLLKLCFLNYSLKNIPSKGIFSLFMENSYKEFGFPDSRKCQRLSFLNSVYLC